MSWETAGTRFRVVVLDDYQCFARDAADWSAIGGDLDLEVVDEHIADPEELLRRIGRADVVVAMRERTPLPRAVLARIPGLRAVITTGGANASIDPPEGVAYGGTRARESPAAELTWSLILAARRHLDVELGAIAGGAWQTTIGEGLEGATLGIVGLGRIGSRVARVGAAFGMEVLAWSSSLTEADAVARGARRVDLDKLLSDSDVVTLHSRLSERTRGLVGARELALMRSGALLVNTARAGLVDHEALLAALRAGTIGGAALDVFPVEPVPVDDSVRSAPRLIVTPHLGFVTRENLELFFGDVVDDIVELRAGRAMRPATRRAGGAQP